MSSVTALTVQLGIIVTLEAQQNSLVPMATTVQQEATTLFGVALGIPHQSTAMTHLTAQSVLLGTFARQGLTNGLVSQEPSIQTLAEGSCGTLAPCAQQVPLVLNMVKQQEQPMHVAKGTSVLQGLSTQSSFLVQRVPIQSQQALQVPQGVQQQSWGTIQLLGQHQLTEFCAQGVTIALLPVTSRMGILVPLGHSSGPSAVMTVLTVAPAQLASTV